MSDIEQRLREQGSIEERLRLPISESMFVRRSDMLRALFAERAEAADTIASLRSMLEEAEGALEPFALVAEYDIGDSESDEDIFRPMDGRNSIAGLVRVGHLRAARRTLASLREADHA